MNKVDMLDAINAKKQQVIDLVNADKLDEAKEAKEELQTMQDKFDLLDDIEVEDKEKVETEEEVIPMAVENKKDAIHEFANAARRGFRNAATDPANETTAVDGGYTVPQDIQTKINQYKEARFALENLVSVEKVNTLSGRRTFVSRANHAGFSLVAEQGAIGKSNIPQFAPISYTVKKYAGYLPVTNELLADSDANISSFLINWLGEEDIATKNALIIAALKTKTKVTMTDLDDIKTAVNVTLGQAFAGSVQIVTNDDGLNYLDTLKDDGGVRYLLSPDMDPDSPFRMRLAVGATTIPVVVVPNGVLATDATDGIPFFVGDFKEAIKIFDREQLNIMTSNVASVTGFNAFEQDMTLFRAIERLDCVVQDTDAWVYLGK